MTISSSCYFFPTLHLNPIQKLHHSFQNIYSIMYLNVIAVILLLSSPVFSNPTPGKDKYCDVTVKASQ